MPLRVKCRCGQEITLRYGDWVYVFLGFVLLCIAVNTVGLLLLYLRLEEPVPSSVGPVEAPATVREAPAAAKPPSGGIEPPRASASKSQGEVTPPRGKPGSPADARDPVLVAATKPANRRELPRTEPSRRRLVGEEASVDELLSKGLEPRKVDVPRSPSGPKPDSVSPPVLGPYALSGEPPGIRLLLAERSRDDALVRAGFFRDPDPIVRRVALGGREVSGAESGPEGDARLEKALETLLAEASRKALRRRLVDLAEGVDLVILIDTSRSMAAFLPGIQEDLAWFLPALAWYVPGTRIGLLAYRDDVVDTRGFSSTPRSDLVPTVKSLEAQGGNDVPEGVHRALRASLSLGPFAWREGVPKHIVLLGDAGPPQAEEAGTLSLAAGAAGAGYRIHGMWGTPEGESYGPGAFFRRLVAEGHGRQSPLGAKVQASSEILASILGDEAAVVGGEILALLRRERLP